MFTNLMHLPKFHDSTSTFLWVEYSPFMCAFMQNQYSRCSSPSHTQRGVIQLPVFRQQTPENVAISTWP